MKIGNMQNRYATVALRAWMLSCDGTNPVIAWKDAAAEVFAEGSPSAEKKVCPKSTFLGLAEAGLVKGIASGQYTSGVQNKRYAEDAVQLLREDASLAETPRKLWNRVAETAGRKQHNGQIDVVLALWNAKKIVGQSA